MCPKNKHNRETTWSFRELIPILFSQQIYKVYKTVSSGKSKGLFTQISQKWRRKIWSIIPSSQNCKECLKSLSQCQTRGKKKAGTSSLKHHLEWEDAFAFASFVFICHLWAFGFGRGACFSIFLCVRETITENFSKKNLELKNQWDEEDKHTQKSIAIQKLTTWNWNNKCQTCGTEKAGISSLRPHMETDSQMLIVEGCLAEKVLSLLLLVLMILDIKPQSVQASKLQFI